ncbi:MAG: DUF6429 family protein [archaeon]|nr:DUF6429 family protein [archaeon]
MERLRLLDALQKKGYIVCSPWAKSVVMTEEGLEQARKLKEKMLSELAKLYDQGLTRGTFQLSKPVCNNPVLPNGLIPSVPIKTSDCPLPVSIHPFMTILSIKRKIADPKTPISQEA